jgi:hypothetical protein
MRRVPILVAVLALVLMGASCKSTATEATTPPTHHVVNPDVGSFSGTYALAAKPGFCGPSGNNHNEVMYVDGANVTVPTDEAGPFTGSATSLDHSSGR